MTSSQSDLIKVRNVNATLNLILIRSIDQYKRAEPREWRWDEDKSHGHNMYMCGYGTWSSWPRCTDEHNDVHKKWGEHRSPWTYNACWYGEWLRVSEEFWRRIIGRKLPENSVCVCAHPINNRSIPDQSSLYMLIQSERLPHDSILGFTFRHRTVHIIQTIQ